MNAAPAADWIDAFPDLADLPADDRRYLIEHAAVVRVPAGQSVFAPGKKPDGFMLITAGTVRVQQTDESGREIVLYRVSAGESCVMTTTCLISDEDYLAEGVTETDVEAVVLSKASFDAIMGRSAEFRRLVFTKYAARMSDLQRLVEDIAFTRMERRLAHKILELAGDDGDLALTHQDLAAELGTAREVISRQLKDIARRGWIETTRGHVRVLDRDALARMAGEDG